MDKPGQKTVMISSTAIDLPDHRKQVFEACNCAEFFPIGMESLPARDADAVRVSIEMVNKANIYIGIFANRYGHIPQGHNISITEIEFNRAVERRIPILIFIAHKDHLFTAEAIETTPGAQSKLKKLKKLVCKGRGRCEFKSSIELRGQVIHALSDIKKRELESRSPVDAIRAQKKRLEELDPKASVQVVADAGGIQYQVNFPHSNLDFLNKIAGDKLKDLYEKGQSFQIGAKDVPEDISPILNCLLRDAGDSPISIHSSAKFRGCLQFIFQSSLGGVVHLQIDGKWTLAQKRALFFGQLADSPLFIEYVRDTGDENENKRCVTKFNLRFEAWEGQPLLGLAYFGELNELINSSNFSVRSVIRGNQVWPAENLITTTDGRQQAIGALDWLHRCREAAKYLKVNPVFPKAESINSNELESKDVQLMIKLIESGTHEQDNAGKTVELSCGNPYVGPEIGAANLVANFPEQVRIIKFFGIDIPFGPFIHTWTDLELVDIRPLEGDRTEMNFRGGATSKWKIEYKRPS